MRLRFLWIGKTRDRCCAGLETRYLKRVGQFLPAELTLVRDFKKSDPHQQAAQSGREAQSIEKKISSGAQVVVLDERGKAFSSEEFARMLQKLMNQGISELIFIVGGHQGIPGRVKALGDFKLSLGPLRLPHELARVVLLEQVYRALTIMKGLPYHK